MEHLSDEQVQTDHPPKKDRFFIVGIGASAGGLEALEQFFSNLRQDTGVAFVVVQHLSPTHKSHMVELLSRHTKMPVQHAINETKVEPNTVYLIPPKKFILIQSGTLKLSEQTRNSLPNYPIDLFFESLAKDRQDRAIGIILSGTGSDGTRGLRQIKEAGGVALVQDPDTAQFDGMPRSAISTMQVDQITSPDKLPSVVISYADNPLFKASPLVQYAPIGSTDALTRILKVIEHYSGVDFTMYKPNTVRRRIEHRMGLKQIYNIDQYTRYLEKTEDEVKRLYREMLIGVTRFFRDKTVFEQIENVVVPDLFETAIEKGQSTIRCWVAGCSSGEEAYSLAMLFHEEQRRRNQHIEIKIFATDIDPDAIIAASSGLYSGSVVADLNPERLSQYFIRKDDHYQISRELRQMIIFAPHNILKDIPFSKVDLITCRNLLIYFASTTQQKVLHNFTYALKPGGYLVLGSSEHISGQENYFGIVDNKNKIFKNKNTHPSLLAAEMLVRDKSTWSTSVGGEIIPNRPSSSTLTDHLRESLATYMPPSVVVNSNFNVLYFFGDTNDFLRLPVGMANLNLLKIVPQSIRTILGTALHKAFKIGEKVLYSSLKMPSNDSTSSQHFDLLVDPLKVNDSIETALVIFQISSNAYTKSESPTNYNIEEETQSRIQDLERRLEYTEESLQAAIEELETSNEELQATNEELIASNEELQSTNEELQSTNEELTTVNAELQKKVGELTEINTDMDYLLDSTELSTIFLDEKLCVRKFSAPATAFFYLQTADIGRPIYHFTHSFVDVDFRAISETVLQTGVPQELEIKEKSDRTFILRATPYKTISTTPRGVVLLFLEITRLQFTDSANPKDDYAEVDVDLANLLSEVTQKIPIPEGIALIIDNQLPIIRTKKNDLELVFYNLISSSVLRQETIPGTITISADTSPRLMTFKIKDTAPALPVKEQGWLTEMLYPHPENPKNEKLGLHLTMAQKTIELNGGRLEIAPRNKSGSTMLFNWPTSLTTANQKEEVNS